MPEDREEPWRISSYCGSGACVEVRTAPERVEVRDARAELTFSTRAWVSFVTELKAGRL